jgi:hypothetical protein
LGVDDLEEFFGVSLVDSPLGFFDCLADDDPAKALPSLGSGSEEQRQQNNQRR